MSTYFAGRFCQHDGSIFPSTGSVGVAVSTYFAGRFCQHDGSISHLQVLSELPCRRILPEAFVNTMVAFPTGRFYWSCRVDVFLPEAFVNTVAAFSHRQVLSELPCRCMFPLTGIKYHCGIAIPTYYCNHCHRSSNGYFGNL